MRYHHIRVIVIMTAGLSFAAAFGQTCGAGEIIFAPSKREVSGNSQSGNYATSPERSRNEGTHGSQIDSQRPGSSSARETLDHVGLRPQAGGSPMRPGATGPLNQIQQSSQFQNPLGKSSNSQPVDVKGFAPWRARWLARHQSGQLAGKGSDSVDDAARASVADGDKLVHSQSRLPPLDPGEGGNCIDLRALRVGDILVTTTNSWTKSKPIQVVTKSPVSHAILYIGNGEVIESVSGGVRKVSLSTALSDATLAVAFRYPELDAARAGKVVLFAQSQVNSSFNTKGIFQQFLCYNGGGVLCTYPTSDAFLCSELVLASYRSAGLKLLTPTAQGMAPGEFARNSVLEYVGHMITP